MRPPLAIGLILLAAVLGVVHGVSSFSSDRERAKQEILEARRKLREKQPVLEQRPEEGPAEGTPPPPPPGATTAPPPAAPPAPPPAAPKPTEEELERAIKTIADAEAAHKRGLYTEEIAFCKAALDLVKEGDDVESLAIRKLAERMIAKAKIFACLKGHVRPNDFASGEGLTRLVYLDYEYIVKIVAKDDQFVSATLASGVPLKLERKDVRDVESFPAEKWRERVERGLRERIEKVDEQSALELYQIAYYCLENGLPPDRAAPWLEKAVERDEGMILVDTFCTENKPTREEIRLALGDRRRPGARPMRPAAAAAPERPVSGEPSAEPGGEPELLADARYRRALTLLEQGRAHYRLTYGSDERRTQEELKKAKAIFDEAFALVQDLGERFPESDEIGARLHELTLIRVDCNKRIKVAR